MLANGERRDPSDLITRQISGLVRVGILLWIFARVAFFTILWLTVLLVAYVGYFTFSFVLLILALALVGAISSWSWVRRIRSWLSGQ